VGPNTSCLLAMCRTAGFARVQFESVLDRRAHVSCFRRWRPRPAGRTAPYVTCVENSVSRDHAFSQRNDDYVSFWFKTDETDLTRDDVFPEIGGYGTRPVDVHFTGGDGWHSNCKLPPGLDPGWYDARLSLRDSAMSNAVRIAIDVPEAERKAPAGQPSGDLEIRLVTDGRTWERYRVCTGAEACVSLWVAGLPDPCDRGAVRVRLNGTDLPAIYVSAHDREGLSQVNALVPGGLQPGRASITLIFGEIVSQPAQVELI
jgi:hypothetical protein